MAQLRAGTSMDELAAGVGAKVTHQTDMKLLQARQYQPLGREFLSGIFGQKAGEVFDAGGPQGIFIARLDAVRPGDLATTSGFLGSIRPKVSQEYLGDLMESTKAAARQAVKVNINLNLARQTMGVDPATVAASNGTGANGTGAKGAGAAK